MTAKAYKARIAASKAALDADLATLAAANPGLSPQAFQALARAKLNTPITLDYAAELIA